MTLLDKKLNVLRVYTLLALWFVGMSIILAVVGFASSVILKIFLVVSVFLSVKAYFANEAYEYELYWSGSENHF